MPQTSTPLASAVHRFISNQLGDLCLSDPLACCHAEEDWMCPVRERHQRKYSNSMFHGLLDTSHLYFVFPGCCFAFNMFNHFVNVLYLAFFWLLVCYFQSRIALKWNKTSYWSLQYFGNIHERQWAILQTCALYSPSRVYKSTAVIRCALWPAAHLPPFYQAITRCSNQWCGFILIWTWHWGGQWGKALICCLFIPGCWLHAAAGNWALARTWNAERSAAAFESGTRIPKYRARF